MGSGVGLSQISDVKLPIFAAPEGLLTGSSRSVSTSPRGGLWTAVGNGISYFDGQTVLNLTTTNGLVNSYAKRTMEARNGELYLIYGSRDLQILNGTQTVAQINQENMPVSMAEDNRSALVSIGSEIYRVIDHKLVPYAYKGGVAPSFYWIVNLFVSQDNSIWVSSAN